MQCEKIKMDVCLGGNVSISEEVFKKLAKSLNQRLLQLISRLLSEQNMIPDDI